MSDQGPARGSDIHSPRVDDQLVHEVSAFVHGAPDEGRTDGRRQEDLVDAEVGEGLHRGDIDPVQPGLDDADLELRSQVAAHVAAARFPATAEELRRVARDDFAPAEVLAILDSLPDGRVYDVVLDIWRDAGGTVEHRG